MILTGIALIPWQLGDWIKQLIKTANQIETPCLGCGLPFHDKDAQFVKSVVLPWKRSHKSVVRILEVKELISKFNPRLCLNPLFPKRMFNQRHLRH
jgi:hypothetical protein